MDNKDERFPLVNEQGDVLGSVSRGEAHSGSKPLHPVVHLHLMNSQGQIYLQKRPEWKDIQPGKWDTACGGHVDYGEQVPQALRREVREELGITMFHPIFIKRYVFESERERELVNVHAAIYDGPVSPSASELAGGRFWAVDEIASNLGQNIFTPNFEQEFAQVLMPWLKLERESKM